jgi:hypothetical protein
MGGLALAEWLPGGTALPGCTAMSGACIVIDGDQLPVPDGRRLLTAALVDDWRQGQPADLRHLPRLRREVD